MGSDVDLLVEFNRPVGLFSFLELQNHLEVLLGCAVDLGTPPPSRLASCRRRCMSS
jgi:predicted nucleotidyltransferase